MRAGSRIVAADIEAFRHVTIKGERCKALGLGLDDEGGQAGPRDDRQPQPDPAGDAVERANGDEDTSGDRLPDDGVDRVLRRQPPGEEGEHRRGLKGQRPEGVDRQQQPSDAGDEIQHGRGHGSDLCHADGGADCVHPQ